MNLVLLYVHTLFGEIISKKVETYLKKTTESNKKKNTPAFEVFPVALLTTVDMAFYKLFGGISGSDETTSTSTVTSSISGADMVRMNLDTTGIGAI